jgi:type IV pilus assembly protein PilA
MKAVQKGFTLIELMIVVAIIGILAAIAIPAYQDYTIRAQVTEGLNLADAVKTSVAEYYAQNGTWPNCMLSGGCAAGTSLGLASDPSGKYVSDITLTAATGQIVITYAGNQANAKLSATPLLDLNPGLSSNGDVVWVCGRHPAPTTPVLATAPPADASTVPDRYLPANCRA